MKHDVFVKVDGGRVPVDMKGVVLDTPEKVRKWLFIDGIRPGYMKTHPELEGKEIEVVEAEGEEVILDRPGETVL